jgi:hypothetical protein
MEKGLQTTFATVVGAVLLLVGIIGFFNNPVFSLFPVNGLHNAIHLISGAIGIWAGVWGGLAASRWFNKIVGIIYIVVAILGWVAPSAMANMLSDGSELGLDNWLHLVLGVVFTGVGFWGND